MSLKVTTWVMENADVKNHGELAVLYALADRAHDDGTCAWPSQAWIAYRARCSTRTVRTHLQSMESRGVIRRGDQRIVGHLDPRYRPVVWDIDLTVCRADEEPAKPSSLATKSRAESFAPGRKNSASRPEDSDIQTGKSEQSGRKGVSDKPSLEPSLEPSREGEGKTGEGSLRSGAPASESTPPPDIPAEWIADPRRARCAAHAGVDTPPPCRGCATTRHTAEAVRDDNRRRAAEAEERRRAERDACALCDDNGMATSDAGLMRCPHDEHALAEAVSAALAASETESDHDPADEPAGPSPALQAWRRRRENRTVRFDGKHLMPAIDHDPNEPMRGSA